MNDVIRKLAAGANFGTIENNEVVFDKRLNKFAELIISDICNWIDNSPTLSEKSIITTNIKNRYGVMPGE